MYLYGLELVVSDALEKNTNTPKRINKNKRIQKKWIKKYGYKKIPDPCVYRVDGKIIGHSKTIDKLLEKINNYKNK